MEVFNTKETLEEATEKIFNIIQYCDNIKKIQNTGYDKTKDARILYFTFVKETLNNYFLSHLLRDDINESWWSGKRLPLPGEDIEVFLKNRRYTFINAAKDITFLTFFSYTEHFLRLIAIAIAQQLSSTERAETKINKIGKTICKKLVPNNNYDKLWDIMCYTRNTLHFGGIHTYPNQSIEYKGKTFVFEQNKSINFLISENFAFLLTECLDFMNAITLANDIKSISLIEHTYANIQFTELDN